MLVKHAAIPRIAQTPLLVWIFRIGFRDNGGNIGPRLHARKNAVWNA